MPLSEHEQRMLEQIENALYAEDPRFASTVQGRRRFRGPSTSRRKIQAAVVFVIGIALLVGGLISGVTIGGFPILSLIGFLVMFGAGMMALWGLGQGRPEPVSSATNAGGAERKSDRRRFADRMEERFNRRFEQE